MLKNLFLFGYRRGGCRRHWIRRSIDSERGNTQVPKTQANNGKQMYVSYCAPCHGVDGKGTWLGRSCFEKAARRFVCLDQQQRGQVPRTTLSCGAAVRHQQLCARYG